MALLNTDHVQAVIKAINQGPYFKHLSMPVKEMGIGYSIVELKVGNEHMNPFGGIHGGAYASVIDTAAYWSAYCELDERVGLISIDLKIDYLAPISDGVITTKGRSIKIGKSMCLAEATATDKDGKWLAHGTSKMMVTKGLQTIEDAFSFTSSKALPPKFI
ncbi:MAG: PaaI family thioesterase [Deltaproteobacteria bacterium]|nr:PaaI family thioesterase [Deltaproteobacteria bacterium]